MGRMTWKTYAATVRIVQRGIALLRGNVDIRRRHARASGKRQRGKHQAERFHDGVPMIVIDTSW
jgi:hypothetical protein